MKRFFVAGMIAIYSLSLWVGPTFAHEQLNYQTVQAEAGKNLRYRKLDNGYLLVLVPGQEIIPSLAAFQTAMHIQFATVTGLGDVDGVQISHFNTKTVKMDLAPFIEDSNEMSSLICSLSTRVDSSGRESAIPHCHVTIGLSANEGNRVVGGHLISARISVVGELFIVTSSQEILKTHDVPFDGNLFDLNRLDVVSIAH